MRNKVAKALRREAMKRKFTRSQYRVIKKRYTRMIPILVELKEGSGIFKWVSVKQQKKALCLS